MFHVKHNKIWVAGKPLKPAEREDIMSKNITAKEFKEIMSKAGYDFEVWGWGGYLNTISILFEESGKLNEIESKFDSAECIKEVARINKEKSHIIFDELEKIGYYNK